MNTILLVIALSCFDTPLKFKLDANVQEMDHYKLLSCQRKRVDIVVGKFTVEAMGLKLYGEIKEDGNSHEMTDQSTGDKYQVKYHLFKSNGFMLMVSSPGKSYVISQKECQ